MEITIENKNFKSKLQLKIKIENQNYSWKLTPKISKFNWKIEKFEIRIWTCIKLLDKFISLLRSHLYYTLLSSSSARERDSVYISWYISTCVSESVRSPARSLPYTQNANWNCPTFTVSLLKLLHLSARAIAVYPSIATSVSTQRKPRGPHGPV